MGIETLNIILFWAFIGILLWQAYIVIFNRGVPNIRTAPALRKKTIDILKENATGKDGYTIVDLGSGNGLFTREMAAALPDAQIIGLEVSRQQLKWANRAKDRENIQNLKYVETNFFDYDLSNIDAIFMYQLEMKQLGEKFKKELKPGAIIISNRFKLDDDWASAESIPVRTLYPHQKCLHVYRV